MATIQYTGVKLSLPDKWEDGTQIVALGPAEGEFRPNVVVSKEPLKASETIEKFAARTLPSLRSALTGYKLVKEGPMKFGKLSGILREHAFNAGGQMLSQLQFYIAHNGKAVTFTFTHMGARFAAARPTAEKIFSTAELS